MSNNLAALKIFLPGSITVAGDNVFGNPISVTDVENILIAAASQSSLLAQDLTAFSQSIRNGHSARIVINPNLASSNYDPTTNIITIGAQYALDFVGSIQGVARTAIGVFAHEIGHATDPNLYTGSAGADPEGIETGFEGLASEGRAILTNLDVIQQVYGPQWNVGSAANAGNYGINPGTGINTLNNVTLPELIQADALYPPQYQDLYLQLTFAASAAVSPPSGAASGTSYLQYYFQKALTDAGVYSSFTVSKIAQVSVYLNPDGTYGITAVSSDGSTWNSGPIIHYGQFPSVTTTGSFSGTVSATIIPPNSPLSSDGNAQFSSSASVGGEWE